MDQLLTDALLKHPLWALAFTEPQFAQTVVPTNMNVTQFSLTGLLCVMCVI